MARGKRLVPTDDERRLVESMSGYGVPIPNIAALIRDGIDDDTLVKHFKKELKQGKAKANSKVGQTLYQKAISGDTAAAIWWSKTQMGWKETNITEVHDHRNMSKEQRDAIFDAAKN